MFRRLVLLALVLSLPGLAFARRGGGNGGGDFGLGLEVGGPTGLTMKYYTGGKANFGIQASLGYMEEFGDRGLNINVDGIWIPAILTDQPSFRLGFYVGVGGRYLDHDERYYYNGNAYYPYHDQHLGVHVPFGLIMGFKKIPMDLFLEPSIVVDVLYFNVEGPYDYHHDHDHFDFNMALGARFYF